MDIDEFLDKEIQVKKPEKEEKPVTIEVDKELNDVIKNYLGLWGKISETKLKWDHNLFKDLSDAEKNVKESLDKSLLTVEHQKTAIRKLIGQALKELHRRNYEAATRLYSEISDIRNKFPDFLLEEKKELNKDIFHLYQKLHEQIDSKFIADFKESIEKINNFTRDAFSHLDFDIEMSKNLYEKALEIYKDLPDGFMSQKLELGKQLLTLYKDLSIQTQIGDLQVQLSKKASGYKFVSDDNRLKRLSEVIKKGHIARPLPKPQSRDLSSRLVARKLDRAKVHLQKGLYLEAKKNIDAILKVHPDNLEAKELLNSIPVEY